MTKTELIEKMAEGAGLSKKDADAALVAFTNAVTECLAKDDKLSIIGFGSFSTSKRAAREGRNPATGEPMKIKASTSVKFKAGSKLKEAVN
jgi:DNA-binding protein HU-beta